MDIIRFAISNPVKVAVGVILLLMFGLIAFRAIPIQLVPNVDQPVVTVETRWTGRSPSEVEKDIIEDQEDQLKGVTNLRKMISEARLGEAKITLEFNIGADMTRALQEVSDKLRQVPDYPDDVDEPTISASEASSEKAIAWIICDSQDPKYDIQGFFDFADKRIKPVLERVPGVSKINIFGGREREVQVRINPLDLAQRGITFADLQRALRQENVNISAGDLSDGRLDYRVRAVGQYDNLDEIRDTVVLYDDDGGPVRVRDIAKVVLTLEKRRSFVRANGKAALAINAIRETGSNVMEVMRGLRSAIREVNQQVLPGYENDRYGIRLHQVYDETVYIDDAIGLVINNLWIGGSLAGIVLLLFLRTIRPTLIISLAIPLSVIGTFVVMTVFGRNLNVISLAGLAFAVGMVVDNAIVVLENIDRHLGMKQTPEHAAYHGSKEVWGAVLASTLTTLVVFIPVLFMQEEAGQLFRDIALAICAAVTLSLIISVTVIPSAAARWLRRRDREETGLRQAGHTLLGLAPLMVWLTRTYAGLIHKLSAPTKSAVAVRLAIITFFVASSIAGAYLLMPPTTYLPKGNQNLIFGIMFTPPSYSIQHNEDIGRRIEKIIRPYWQAQTIEQASRIGPVFARDLDPKTGRMTIRQVKVVPPINHFFFVSFGGSIFMGASSKDKALIRPLENVLNGAMNTIPGAFGIAQQSSIFGRGLSGANTIDVEVTGTDMASLRQSSQAIYGALAGEFGYDKIRPDPLNFNLAGPELQVVIDQVKAKDFGVDQTLTGLGVQALVDGALVGDYQLHGESIDLKMVRDPSFKLTPDTLGMVPVAVRDANGHVRTVPLSSIAEIRPAEAPQQINRIEQLRAIKFGVTPPEEVPLQTAEQRIGRMVEKLRAASAIAPGIDVALAGTADKLTQVRTALLGKWSGWNRQSVESVVLSRMFIALTVVYLLMAALLESFLYPFVIMFSVPLAAVGGFIGLAIVHAFIPTQQLDVLTMLGFVILIGVVVNNAILLVHQALNFMRGLSETGEQVMEKLSPRQAISESVRTRIRPIFMTTLTSVFGMLPLVLMPGSGSELYRGLGSVVVGGLVVSTLFTLLVVPLVFSLVLDIKAQVLRLFGQTTDQAVDTLVGVPVEV